MPFKGFVTTLRPPRPGGDCVGQKELLINKGLRVEQGCWQVVVQSPEGCEMRIHNCHPVATLKEITPCLSVSYELPTTGLACRVFGDFLAAFWAPILRATSGRQDFGHPLKTRKSRFTFPNSNSVGNYDDLEMYAVIEDRWKLIENRYLGNAEPVFELYDLSDDPLARISVLALARPQYTSAPARMPRLFALNPAHPLRR